MYRNQRNHEANKMAKQNFIITALVTLILTVVIVSIVNVGMSLFYERPEYSDFCGEIKFLDIIEDREQCESIGGKWDPESVRPVGIRDGETMTLGYCDRDFTCRQEYEEEEKAYNQVRFYVFVSIGLVLALIGLFVTIPLVQYISLLSGLILIGEGIVFNFQNKIAVFITLIVVLILIIFAVWKVFTKAEKDVTAK